LEEEAGVITEKKEKGNFERREKGVTLGELWSGRFWQRTLCVWVAWFGINFGYYGFVLWIPTLLVGKGFLSY